MKEPENHVYEKHLQQFIQHKPTNDVMDNKYIECITYDLSMSLSSYIGRMYVKCNCRYFLHSVKKI